MKERSLAQKEEKTREETVESGPSRTRRPPPTAPPLSGWLDANCASLATIQRALGATHSTQIVRIYRG